MSTDVPFISLARVLRGGWIVILVSTLLFGALGALGWYLYTPKYKATSTVEITGVAGVTVSSSGSSTAAATNMQTEQAVATSTGVLAAALGDLNGWSLQRLQNSVSVIVPKDADVLQMTVKDPSAKAAAKASNAVARAYLDDRRSEVDAAKQHELKQLESQITTLDQQLATTAGRLQRQAVLAQRDEVSAQYASARASINQPGRLLSAAIVPTSPSTPGLPIWVAAGLVVGLLLGTYVASLRERARRVRYE